MWIILIVAILVILFAYRWRHRTPFWEPTDDRYHPYHEPQEPYGDDGSGV